MWSLYVLLVLLPVPRCAGTPKLETITEVVGKRVILKCPRQYKPTEQATLHWISLLSRSVPEFLGATFTFDYKEVNKTPPITTKQGKGTFDLIIDAPKLSDTGFYCCVQVRQLQMELVTRIFLKITVPDSDLSVESPDLSGAVDSGDSVDLQCWVQTEKAHCFEEHMVWWFRSGLDRSSTGLVYAQRNSSGRCDGSSEEHGPHKCFYSFSKTVSPSDSGTYRCAVAACGQILFGNRVEVKVYQTEKTWLLILLITIFGLICVTLPVCWTVKKLNKPNKGHSKQKQQVLTRKADCEAALHRTIKAAETESIYTQVIFVYVK